MTRRGQLRLATQEYRRAGESQVIDAADAWEGPRVDGAPREQKTRGSTQWQDGRADEVASVSDGGSTPSCSTEHPAGEGRSSGERRPGRPRLWRSSFNATEAERVKPSGRTDDRGDTEWS